jgi:hypothetical protein
MSLGQQPYELSTFSCNNFSVTLQNIIDFWSPSRGITYKTHSLDFLRSESVVWLLANHNQFYNANWIGI